VVFPGARTINIALLTELNNSGARVFIIINNLAWQEFQGNRAFELGVFGFIHHSHPAMAKLLYYSIMGNGFTDHQLLLLFHIHHPDVADIFLPG
jgi:hypothetical protein